MIWTVALAWLRKYLAWIVVALVASAFAGGGYIGWELARKQAIEDHAEAVEAANRAFVREVERHNEVVSKLETDLAAARKQTRVITKEVIREVARPEYQCPVPDSGVRLLNSSRQRPPARSFGSDAAVSAATSAP